MHDDNENFHYPELAAEPLNWSKFLLFLLNTVVNSLYWGKDCLRLHVTSLVLLENISKKYNVILQQSIKHIPPLKYWYTGSIPSDNVPLFPSKIFANINTHPAVCRLSIGYRLQTFVTNCFLQTLSDVKCSVSPSSSRNWWRQNHYSPITAFAASTRHMELFISPSSAKKKLLEIMMVMYFISYVSTCNYFFSSM